MQSFYLICMSSPWTQDEFDELGLYLLRWCWSLTPVEGNINCDKYTEILEKNLWPVIVWYFEDK